MYVAENHAVFGELFQVGQDLIIRVIDLVSPCPCHPSGKPGHGGAGRRVSPQVRLEPSVRRKRVMPILFKDLGNCMIAETRFLALGVNIKFSKSLFLDCLDRNNVGHERDLGSFFLFNPMLSLTFLPTISTFSFTPLLKP